MSKQQCMTSEPRRAESAVVRLRYFCDSDAPAVLALLHANGDDRDAEALRKTRRGSTVGLVAVARGAVVGYMLHRVVHYGRGPLEILDLAVHPACARRGVGTVLMNRLKDRLIAGRREEIVATLHERNLAGQLFLRANGFRAVAILRGEFGREGDGYVFEYRLAPEPFLPGMEELSRG